MDVSVIIVNYNTCSLLADCIDSIYEKTMGVEYEVIVVDNASSDDSIRMLHCDYPDVLVVETGGNIGFGRANNLGMERASGKYLFLLNSDTVLVNNAIKIFYDSAESLKNNGFQIGSLGSILLRNDMTSCHSYGSFITPDSELREVIAKYIRFLKPKSNTCPDWVKDVLDVDYVTGADMFVPSEVYKTVGGFDPDFFMYCEEVDWQKRMCEVGLKRLIVGGPEIIHLEGGSDKDLINNWSISRLENFYKSRKIYRKKHYNKKLLFVIKVILALLDAPSLIMLAVLKKEKRYIKLIKLK